MIHHDTWYILSNNPTLFVLHGAAAVPGPALDSENIGELQAGCEAPAGPAEWDAVQKRRSGGIVWFEATWSNYLKYLLEVTWIIRLHDFPNSKTKWLERFERSRILSSKSNSFHDWCSFGGTECSNGVLSGAYVTQLIWLGSLSWFAINPGISWCAASFPVHPYSEILLVQVLPGKYQLSNYTFHSFHSSVGSISRLTYQHSQWSINLPSTSQY